MMRAIKRAVSPKIQRPMQGEMTMPATPRTPLTDFICSRLQGAQHQLFAVMFAEAIKNDRHAKVVLFENVYKFLGYELYQHAVRQLKRLFPEAQPTPINNLTSSGEVFPGTRGPSKDNYLISVRQFETLMLAAKTEEGALARAMMLDVKDAVQDYMKMEMEASAREAQQQLEYQTSKLAIEEARRVESDAKRSELEAVQSRLQATIESQRKREEKKEARKKQQKQPLETAYLISNNPGGQGPFKCGMTEKEAKHRAKSMQTGNHEPVIVIAAIPCMNAELIEKVMHQIFYDYRTNDRLEWFDAPLDSMKSTLSFLIESIDGLNRVDHDENKVSEHLDNVLTHMRGAIIPVRGLEEEAEGSTLQQNSIPSLSAANDSYADFWTACMIHHGDRNRAVNRTAVKAVFKDWMKRHRFPEMTYAQMKAYWDSRMTHMDTTRACGKVKGYVEWDVKESLKTNENSANSLPDL